MAHRGADLELYLQESRFAGATMRGYRDGKLVTFLVGRAQTLREYAAEHYPGVAITPGERPITAIAEHMEVTA